MNGLSETRYNACLPVRCKTCLFHSHLIGTDRKLLCSKETLLTRCYSTGLIGQRVFQRNFRVENHSAAGVAHHALKGCSNPRRLSGSVRRAKQQGKRYGNPYGNITHGKRTASQNHLQFTQSNKILQEKRNISCSKCNDGTSGCRQQTELGLSVFLDWLWQISRYAVGGEDSSHQKTAQ